MIKKLVMMMVMVMMIFTIGCNHTRVKKDTFNDTVIVSCMLRGQYDFVGAPNYIIYIHKYSNIDDYRITFSLSNYYFWKSVFNTSNMRRIKIDGVMYTKQSKVSTDYLTMWVEKDFVVKISNSKETIFRLGYKNIKLDKASIKEISNFLSKIKN